MSSSYRHTSTTDSPALRSTQAPNKTIRRTDSYSERETERRGVERRSSSNEQVNSLGAKPTLLQNNHNNTEKRIDVTAYQPVLGVPVVVHLKRSFDSIASVLQEEPFLLLACCCRWPRVPAEC
nr:hypothetical protein Iba_chr04cCG19560 [Ipomoea batatas]